MAEGDSRKKNTIFIGWSGDKAKAAAEALKDFIGNVIQASDPWVSSQDIPSGDTWDSTLHKVLEHAVFGISCLTVENFERPWVNYEAGAMSQKLQGSYCPYLIDVPSKNALGPTPLTRLQARESNKDETRKLVEDICGVLGEDFGRIQGTFHLYWDGFESKLQEIRNASPAQEVKRGSEEMLEEILSLAQSINKAVGEISAKPTAFPSGALNALMGIPTGMPREDPRLTDNERLVALRFADAFKRHRDRGE